MAGVTALPEQMHASQAVDTRCTMPIKLRRVNRVFSDRKNKAPPQHAYSCAALVADGVNGESTELSSAQVSDTVPRDDWAS